MIYAILAVTIPVPTRRQKLTVLICPKCRAYIPVCSKFCPDCGADLRFKRKHD